MFEIKEKDELLDEFGKVRRAGYSKKMLLKYDRTKIKAGKMRIKEWDYYLVHNDKFGVALTVADNSYMSLLSASVLDFENKTEKTTSVMKWFTNGHLNTDEKTGEKFFMPSSSESGNIFFKDSRCEFKFAHEGKDRRLYCKLLKFKDGQTLEVDIKLLKEPQESMVIATPFKEKETAFYYNQKIVGFTAEGYAKVGEEVIEFKKENSFGLLDWGRGVWTYKNTWYWGAGMTKINGKVFGFNVGYGFGDVSNATENMLFYDGKAHKIENVTFNIPTKNKKDDFLSPWTFTSSDGRFEMQFNPILNRHSDTNVLVIRSNQNQVFGYFNGYAILDDGTKIEVKDMLAFAEKVYNKW